MSPSDPALEALYRTRYTRFVATAASVVGSVDGGHDVVQEAFARALRVDRPDEGGSLEAWVWRIVLNAAFDARRRRAVSAPSGPPEPELLDDRLDPVLAAAIRALPPRRRLVVFLRYFADLPLDEIAERCGIAVGTVSATLDQARSALRVELEAGGSRS